jgi:flagellar biosynthesis chaperone FliJ
VTLRNERELANTRDKLHLLEDSYEELRNETGGDEELREASMESLKRFINQLKEEIARYEAHQPARG